MKQEVYGMVDQTHPTGVNVIDFITIASTGNAVDFGDLTHQQIIKICWRFSSPTRGIFLG